jgi:hypothetical protein
MHALIWPPHRNARQACFTHTLRSICDGVCRIAEHHLLCYTLLESVPKHRLDQYL